MSIKGVGLHQDQRMKEGSSVNVCMVTSRHNPLDSRIFYKEAVSLKRHGFNPIIVSGSHNGRRTVQGIRICGFRRGKLSVRMSRLLQIDWITVFKLFVAGMQSRSLIYHAHELEALIAAFLCKVGRLWNHKPVRVIYDVHEWYPELYNYRVRELLRYKVLRVLDRFFARRADLVIVTEKEKAERYAAYRSKNDVLILGHFPPLDLFDLSLMHSRQDEGSLVVGYVGGLSLDRGCLTMLEAVSLAQKKIGRKLKVLYVGEFSLPSHQEQTIQYAQRESIELEMTGWIPYEAIPGEIHKMDICLALLHPRPYYMEAIPTKLFEYMAAGKPVIASDFDNVRAILEPSGAGVTVNPLDTGSISDALLELIHHPERRSVMSESGRNYIENGHHWGILERALVEHYEELLKGSSKKRGNDERKGETSF
jgi:glycosyltransferase involved in cell wall biosynthesis